MIVVGPAVAERVGGEERDPVLVDAVDLLVPVLQPMPHVAVRDAPVPSVLEDPPVERVVELGWRTMLFVVPERGALPGRCCFTLGGEDHRIDVEDCLAHFFAPPLTHTR